MKNKYIYESFSFDRKTDEYWEELFDSCKFDERNYNRLECNGSVVSTIYTNMFLDYLKTFIIEKIGNLSNIFAFYYEELTYNIRIIFIDKNTGYLNNFEITEKDECWFEIYRKTIEKFNSMKPTSDFINICGIMDFNEYKDSIIYLEEKLICITNCSFRDLMDRPCMSTLFRKFEQVKLDKSDVSIEYFLSELYRNSARKRIWESDELERILMKPKISDIYSSSGYKHIFDFIEMEILIVSTIDKKMAKSIISKHAKEVINTCLNILKEDKRFKKFGIPISFLKVSNCCVSNQHYFVVRFELKNIEGFDRKTGFEKENNGEENKDNAFGSTNMF